MPNYQNGKIYSIRSPNNEKYYIGSTTQRLSCRMTGHRKIKNETSKEIINNGGAYIELIENYPCNNKEELCKREGELIRQFKDNIVNKRIEGNTKEQYRKNEGRFVLEKQYEKAKIKYNCECGSILRTGDKSSHLKTNKHINFIENN
jgi:hypothetical protein